VRALRDALGRPGDQRRHHPDVSRHRHVREEPDLLQHVARLPAQCRGIPLPRVASRDTHASAVRLEHAVDQFQDRALAGAAAADERQRLAARHREADAAQHLMRAAAEPHVVELDHPSTLLGMTLSLSKGHRPRLYSTRRPLC